MPSVQTNRPPRNAGEILNSRGLGVVVLPVSGVTVEFRVPRTIRAIQAGLFPLMLADSPVLEEAEPEAREAILKENENSARLAICAACVSPRFVDRKPRGPKFNEAHVDSLVAEDFAVLAAEITKLICQAYEKNGTGRAVSEEEVQAKYVLSLACQHFGLDPTEVAQWPADRSTSLLEFFEYGVNAELAEKYLRKE